MNRLTKGGITDISKAWLEHLA